MNQVYFRNHEYYRSEFPLPPEDERNEKTKKDRFFGDHDNVTPILLQKIIDASGSSIAILDKYQTISYVNRAWRQFATRTGSMAIQFGIGNRYPEMAMGVASMSAADAAIISKGIDHVIAESEVEFSFEYQSTAIAETAWFRLHAAEFRFPDENCDPLISVTHDDITVEKLTADLLRRDRERLGRLLAVTKILHWEADPETGGYTYISEQAEPMLGYPREAWLEPSFWSGHIHPDDREWAIAESSKLSQCADEYHIEYRMVAKDDRIVWVNDNVSIHRENGLPTKMTGFMIDVTERKHTENTLRLLGGRLITAQEEERKRIARELHDDLNQKMALLSIELEQIGQTLKTDTVRAGERIKELQKNAFKISKDIHQISYMLHPSKLDHLGLVPALNSFCEELSEARDLSIHFTHEGFPAAIPPNTTLCLFRIAQEGLQNAVKHSGASNVDISLKKTNSSMELTISDPGCGFDLKNDNMDKGLGFISMRERLRLVNGDMKIRSRPLQGTQLNISVPLKNTESVRPTWQMNK